MKICGKMYGNPLRMALATLLGRFGGGSGGGVRGTGNSRNCYRKSGLAARISFSMRFGLTGRNYQNAGRGFIAEVELQGIRTFRFSA